MSEHPTDFDAFNQSMKNTVLDPGVAIDFTGIRLTNALSFLRGVELYWAYHLDLPTEDYPDQLTAEQQEQIRKDRVVHAGYLNKAWTKVLAGDFRVINHMDRLEQADPQNLDTGPEKDHRQQEENPLEVLEVDEIYLWKHNKFMEHIIPALDDRIVSIGYSALREVAEQT